MGAVLAAGMSLTSCGNARVKLASQEPPQISESAAAASKSIEKPEDLHVITKSEMKSNMENTFAHLAFDKDIVMTSENMMPGNAAVEELYFDHVFEMINTGAFKGCKNLKAVYCEDIVNIVGDDAFNGCTSLKEYAGNTATLGIDAFRGCTSLEKVILYDKGWKIRTGALAECPALKTLILPINFEEFEEEAFTGTNNIENLAIPYNMRKVVLKQTAACKNIKNIYILTVKPYAFENAEFNKAQCTAYVPDNMIDTFKEDPSWSGFAAIKPLSESEYYTAECKIK